jgi:homopolymeric O-antigen transport system ATP-binding protein
MSAFVSVTNLTIRFPVYGVDSRSLKKHIARAAVGGKIDNSRFSVQVVTALTDVNLVLRPGDRLGLIGPNGAGKTTLLRCIAGAYEPDFGTIEVHGRIASLLDLGLGLDASATGYDNIRLRGLIAGLSQSEIDACSEGIAEFSGLGPYLDLPMKTYSAGMAARLAFAVTTSIDAEVLLLDEWLAVGDAGFREQAHERLLGLVQRSKIMVFASHNLEMVRSYCNRIMRVDGGRASAVHDISALDELIAA